MIENNSPIKSQIETLANILGEDPEAITVFKPKWVELMKMGVIVDVHVRRWRMVARLNYEDLGIPEPDNAAEREALEELFNLGDKYLMPIEVIKESRAIESGLRKTRESLGYKTPWGYMVTAEDYPTWKEAVSDAKIRYQALANRLYEEWEEVISRMVDKYAVEARVAYRRLRALDEKGMTEVQWMAEDLFVDKFISKVLASIPDKVSVYNSFQIETDVRYIPLPSMLAEEEAYAQKIRQEVNTEVAVNQARLEMERDVMETFRAERETLVVEYMKGLVSQVNSALYNAANDILDSVKKHGRIHPRSSLQLKNLVSRLKGLAEAMDYKDVEVMLSQAEVELEKDPKERKVEDLEKKLRAIGTVTRSTLVSLGETPRSGKEVGIIDSPALAEVKRARKVLGLSPEIGALPEKRGKRKEA